MRALSAAELLDVWERGLAQSPAQRALTLLAMACAETPLEQLAQWSVGQRDAKLLTLREETFGPRLASITSCPACAEQLEFNVEAGDLRAGPVENSETLQVTGADHMVEFRLPTGLDLASLDPQADSETNRGHLLQRCVLRARRGNLDVASTELPAEIVRAMTHRMSEVDPEAEVGLALACPHCQHAWQATLDIVSYFWTEIHAWAERTLREIHALASAYGWREADVLALSRRRRQTYLELIEA